MNLGNGRSIEQTDLDLLGSSDDSVDPTYKPDNDNDLKIGKKNVPDYFGVRQTKQFKSKPSCDTDQASTSSSSNNISQDFVEQVSTINTNITGAAFEEYPYLDGKIFKVTSSVQPENQGKSLTTECQLCLPKQVQIKGAIGVSTNFLKHLKKCHSNQDAYKSYCDYKEKKKEARRNTRNS